MLVAPTWLFGPIIMNQTTAIVTTEIAKQRSVEASRGSAWGIDDVFLVRFGACRGLSSVGRGLYILASGEENGTFWSHIPGTRVWVGNIFLAESNDNGKSS